MNKATQAHEMVLDVMAGKLELSEVEEFLRPHPRGRASIVDVPTLQAEIDKNASKFSENESLGILSKRVAGYYNTRTTAGKADPIGHEKVAELARNHTIKFPDWVNLSKRPRKPNKSADTSVILTSADLETISV